jgi:hypothetical protein
MLLTTELVQKDILDRTRNYTGLTNLLSLNNQVVDKQILITHIINIINSTDFFYYDTIDAPLDYNINNSVKGPRYKYLYDIIQKMSIILIWHNKNINKYEFWATSKKKLNRSMWIIKNRINEATKYHNKKNLISHLAPSI